MSSLNSMTGARFKMGILTAMQQCAEDHIRIARRKIVIIRSKQVAGGVLLLAIALLFVIGGLHQEDQREDTQIKTWRAEGYPVPN